MGPITRYGLEFDLLVGAISFVLYATILCVLGLVVALICRITGKRRTAARLSHWARLVLLFNAVVSIWTIGLAATGQVAGLFLYAPLIARISGVVPVWGIGTLLWFSLTLRGWLWLTPRSTARYQRALAHNSVEATTALATGGP